MKENCFKKICVLSIFLSSIGLTGIAAAQSGACSNYGMMNWMFGGTAMGFFGFITWLLAIIVLILLIFWLMKQVNKK